MKNLINKVVFFVKCVRGYIDFLLGRVSKF